MLTFWRNTLLLSSLNTYTWHVSTLYVYMCQTVLYHFLEGNNLHRHCCENIKSHRLHFLWIFCSSRDSLIFSYVSCSLNNRAMNHIAGPQDMFLVSEYYIFIMMVYQNLNWWHMHLEFTLVKLHVCVFCNEADTVTKFCLGPNTFLEHWPVY